MTHLLVFFLCLQCGLALSLSINTTIVPFGTKFQANLTSRKTVFEVPIRSTNGSTHFGVRAASAKLNVLKLDDNLRLKITVIDVIQSTTRVVGPDEKEEFVFGTADEDQSPVTVFVQVIEDLANGSNLTEIKVPFGTIELELFYIEEIIPLKNQTKTVTFSGAKRTLYMLIDPTKGDFTNNSYLILILDSPSNGSADVCLFVSVHPLDCGSHDEEDRWTISSTRTTSATMLEKLTLVLSPNQTGATSKMFDRKFFLKMTIFPENICNSKRKVLNMSSQLRLPKNRTSSEKEVTLRFRQIMSTSEQDFIITVTFCVTLLIGIFCALLVWFKYTKVKIPETRNDVELQALNIPNGQENHPDDQSNAKTPESTSGQNNPNSDQNGQVADSTREITESSPNGHLKWKVPKSYLAMVIQIGLVYCVCSSQYPLLLKSKEDDALSYDFCFYNSRCAHPRYGFSDFNHIISNIPYAVYGLSFMVIVFLRSRLLKLKDFVRENGLFYAMSIAMIFQSFVSGLYHICPTESTLQFDTTMMYVVCVLFLLQVYQSQHVNKLPSSWYVSLFVIVLVILEASNLYLPKWMMLSAFLVGYVIIVVFLAFKSYYSNQPESQSGTEQRIQTCKIDRSRQFIFSLIFVAINFAIFLLIAVNHVKAQNNFSHAILVVLGLNTFIYATFIKFKWIITKRIREKLSRARERWILIGVDIFFLISGLGLGVWSLTFYSRRSSDRRLSPAKSRNLNADCEAFEFYDCHDLWHLVGGTAIFFMLLYFLTFDDRLLFKEQENQPRSNQGQRRNPASPSSDGQDELEH